jgi:hypothetical protein
LLTELGSRVAPNYKEASPTGLVESRGLPTRRHEQKLAPPPRSWEIPTMIIADDKKRLRIPAAHPRDVYHPETLSRDLIVLRRVEPPKRKKRMTREQILRAIENSPIKVTKSWDELKLEIR